MAWKGKKTAALESRFRLAKFITVSTRGKKYAIHEDDMQGREDQGDSKVLHLLVTAREEEEESKGKPYHRAAAENK